MTVDELRDKVIRYRAKHDMSQREFADKCKVTKSTVWSLEKGRCSPSKLTETKIMIVLEEGEEDD